MHYLDYNEQKKHGTDEFPVEYYFVTEKHPRYNMPFHWHREVEMIRIISGYLTIYLDDEEITAGKGDILFINEGVVHGGIPDNCIYECVVLDSRILLTQLNICRKYIGLMFSHKISINSLFPKDNEQLQRTAFSLFDTLKNNEDVNSYTENEMIITGKIFEIFGTLFRDHIYQKTMDIRQSGTKKISLIKPVLEYIDQNYDQMISLQKLAKLSGMTPKYFCHYFYTVIHRTPIDYLNYYRIERACSLLYTSDLSVTEIGFQCGFNDSSYFIKTFKKYKGITPKQYLGKDGDT
ncbi:AraC family transcriptional regulator [Cuneatibacter caecimuris]|uniref:AraC-like DNA-binding protein n=1 Tax=Cuneatibacter caecimuris TaxID=1796618 RepID=A0A4Q7P4K1_9FIRM|nr:AraC family transcriptional regulator [Cuneatibacter caecimuris]RZS94370.1 AraC-like DNA-binding protein [Cuneatibacter caecimuris]